MKKCWILIGGLLSLSLHAQTPAPKVANMIRGGDMELLSQDHNPWGGVVGGNLRVFTSASSLIDNTGTVSAQEFPCAVSAGDLNGDGLPDLMVVDSSGYFWYFQNFGVKKEKGGFDSVFKRGEIMATWLGGRICPKIHLLDINDDGKLDLILGDFTGRLFFIRNVGSPQEPKFEVSTGGANEEVKTDKNGKYWCNYLSPHYYDWDGDGKKDIIMGEGTFSANSIFLLKNTGGTNAPSLEARHLLIQGFGKEHLTPWVLDWDGDGKPDIITGERDKGVINIYINTTVDQSKGPWTFKEPVALSVGTASSSGSLSAPVFADMNGDGLLDMLMGSGHGNIRLAINKGTAKDAKFEAFAPIKGEPPFPKYFRNGAWSGDLPGGVGTPDGARFHLLRVMTKNEKYKDTKDIIGFDPELELSKETTGKSCLLLDFIDPKQVMFKGVPRTNGDTATYTIAYPDTILLKPEAKYELTFQVKGSGFSNARVVMTGSSSFLVKTGSEERYGGESLEAIKNPEFSFSSGWAQVTKQIHFKKDKADDKKKEEEFYLSFYLEGDGTFYLDDVVLVEKKQ